MRKILSSLVALCMLPAIFAGCGSEPEYQVVGMMQKVGGDSSSSGEDSGTESSVPPEADASSDNAAAPKAEDSSALEKTTVRIAGMKGPTTMGLVGLLDNSSKGASANDYRFEMFGTADEIVAKFAKNELDIAAVPCNLASVLYNNTQGNIKLAAVNTLGVLYIVETGDTIRSISDLKGQTLYTTGKGTTPEYALNYILRKNGIDPEKDVTIEYKSEATEVVASMELSSAATAIAMLPEPFVTTAKAKNPMIRTALDLTEEWDKIGEGSTLVTGVAVVSNQFLQEHKDALDMFLKEYQESIQYVNAIPAEAAKLIEAQDIAPAAVAEQAIPNCNIQFLSGTEMKTKVSGYLQSLYDQNPKSVGGKLPDDAFYYQG